MSQPETAAAGDKPRPRRLRGLLINIAIVLVIFLGVQWFKSRPLASGTAPALTGQAVSGEMVDLGALRGAPVLVHFWATWCPTCKLEEGSIDAIARDYQVVTVAMQSGSERDIADYLRERSLGFDAVADPYGEIATAWGVRGVPASFVVGADGEIRFGAVGYTPGIGLRAHLWAAGQE
jgi:thiol-disulfide isomerase/thioredoxin